MAWATPEFDHLAVNEAGRQLVKMLFPVTTPEGRSALEIINNWRSAHAYPLNTFQITLRRKGRKVERSVIVSQRTKRLESIHAKLVRQPTMRMSQMQDIAGCRAVFRNLVSVRRLTQRYKASQFDHILRGEKDYIAHPKPDGYRCNHLVYEYCGTDATAAYNGTKIEIQIRTQLQHAWATAVEAVGIFTKQALKSNLGDEDWLRFFALMGSAIAAIEQTPPVPDTPQNKNQLIEEIEHLVQKLHVEQMLMVYNTSIQLAGQAKDAKYFLLQLDPEATPPKITIWRYKAKESEQANAHYTDLESDLPEASECQIVLVSADDVNALRRAYPNYFLDTRVFANTLSRVLAEDFPDPLLL
jgi:Region found in RelA / SpoT proteins